MKQLTCNSTQSRSICSRRSPGLNRGAGGFTTGMCFVLSVETLSQLTCVHRELQGLGWETYSSPTVVGKSSDYWGCRRPFLGLRTSDGVVETEPDVTSSTHLGHRTGVGIHIFTYLLPLSFRGNHCGTSPFKTRSAFLSDTGVTLRVIDGGLHKLTFPLSRLDRCTSFCPLKYHSVSLRPLSLFLLKFYSILLRYLFFSGNFYS